MRRSSGLSKKQRPQSRGCEYLCCGCRLSVSSSEEDDESDGLDRVGAISSLAHALVQERLDQMIRERQEARRAEQRKRRMGRTEFILIVAVEMESYDPVQDFKDSMAQMITSTGIVDAKGLRRLLDWYLSVNCEDSRGVILEAFYDVCFNLFVRK
ncbi:probable transcription repressor OFP9 [Eucalyptus grandis]|uniref:probable transcription repressor OFP9 n=1 Tax=Eucalyptus grandis TaxID=71139 RepID=UPI00192E98B7|nr:probable transcription repressor OFP9 [Eucalyptus grandis]